MGGEEESAEKLISEASGWWVEGKTPFVFSAC